MVRCLVRPLSSIFVLSTLVMIPSARAECTHDAGTCSTNSDCCSGECDYSNGTKVCWPKLGRLKNASKPPDAVSATKRKPSVGGLYKGKYLETAGAYVLQGPVVSVSLPKRDVVKQKDGKLVIKSLSKADVAPAKEPREASDPQCVYYGNGSCPYNPDKANVCCYFGNNPLPTCHSE